MLLDKSNMTELLVLADTVCFGVNTKITDEMKAGFSDGFMERYGLKVEYVMEFETLPFTQDKINKDSVLSTPHRGGMNILLAYTDSEEYKSLPVKSLLKSIHFVPYDVVIYTGGGDIFPKHILQMFPPNDLDGLVKANLDRVISDFKEEAANRKIASDLLDELEMEIIKIPIKLGATDEEIEALIQKTMMNMINKDKTDDLS